MIPTERKIIKHLTPVSRMPFLVTNKNKFLGVAIACFIITTILIYFGG